MRNIVALSVTLAVCAITWTCARLLKGTPRLKRFDMAATSVQILALLLAVMSVVGAFLPPLPCEPMQISVGRRSSGGVTVDTLNFALPYLCALLLFLLALAAFLLYLMTPAYRRDTAGQRKERLHRGQKKAGSRYPKTEIQSPQDWSVKQRLLLVGGILLCIALSALLIVRMTTLQ